MGREAVCHCEWGDESGECKVLLESDAVIARGPLRRQTPIASMTEIRVDGDALRFRAGAASVSLLLGAKRAQSWLSKLTAPPVTLAAKLGVVPGMKILLLGHAESEALTAALAEAVIEKRSPELVVLCAESPAEFERDLKRAAAFAAQPAIWVIYRKGARSELGESAARGRMRSLGFIDTKVAAVDGAYTALRFIRRG
jgi:ribosomal protein L30E